MNHLIGSRNKFLVKWKDYNDEFNTWEPEENLTAAKDLVEQYFEFIKAKKTQKHKKTPRLKRAVSSDSITSQTSDNISFFGGTNDYSDTINHYKDEGDTDDDNEYDDEADFMDADTFHLEQQENQLSLDDDIESDYDDGLDRITYDLQKEDGVFEKITVIVDETYPSDDVNWDDKIDSIVVTIGKNDCERNKDKAILKWRNGKYSLHSINDIRKYCPQHLIDYYQQYVLY
ncbi:unnamed protein product [Absidia cylindrospora]